MSTIQIELLKKVDWSQPAGKTYRQMTVTHNNITEGKVDGKKIMDFATPPAVWDGLVAANVGDKFSVTREKDKKEGKYWQWTEIKPLADGEYDPSHRDTAAEVKPTRSYTTTTPTKPVGNWETHEERAARQIMIVRQSSLSTAVALNAAQPERAVYSPQDVIEVAKEFEAYVLGTDKEITAKWPKGAVTITNDQPE